MKFTKLQGTGNDFVLIEAGGIDKDWTALAKAMCHRHLGIGADGLLLLLPSAKADFGMRVFNPDGSEAEACGNGLRCLARYVLEKGLAGKKEARIETAAGTRLVRFGGKGGGSHLQVSMGIPQFRVSEIPVDIEKSELDIIPVLNHPLMIDDCELRLDFLSMGNPHAVCFLQKPVSDFPLARLGPRIEHHELFPNRINFEIARVLAWDRIEARVWERGVGETQACGTGACAVAVAAQLHAYTGNKVNIILPGGTLDVEWDGKGEVFLGGPAEIVFTGDWEKEQVK